MNGVGVCVSRASVSAVAPPPARRTWRARAPQRRITPSAATRTSRRRRARRELGRNRDCVYVIVGGFDGERRLCVARERLGGLKQIARLSYAHAKLPPGSVSHRQYHVAKLGTERDVGAIEHAAIRLAWLRCHGHLTATSVHLHATIIRTGCFTQQL